MPAKKPTKKTPASKPVKRTAKPKSQASADEAALPQLESAPEPAPEIRSESPLAASPAAAPIPPVAPQPLPQPVPPPVPQTEPLSPSEERTWAMLAHLSVLSNLITGFLGPIVALAVYLIFRDRSRYVAYHSLQAFIFQLIWWGGGGLILGLMWAGVGILSAFIVGLLLIPFACVLTPAVLLMPIGALVYGTLGGIQASQGQDFKYWLVGDWVRGTLTGE
jgi:uncharacterized Tic20 family protein